MFSKLKNCFRRRSNEDVRPVLILTFHLNNKGTVACRFDIKEESSLQKIKNFLEYTFYNFNTLVTKTIQGLPLNQEEVDAIMASFNKPIINASEVLNEKN